MNLTNGEFPASYFWLDIKHMGIVTHPPSYRVVPTFGRDTIRRFANNVSEMKKLAARDFEDILQVTHGHVMFLDELTGVCLVVCNACV
jgi:hypothetical protein